MSTFPERRIARDPDSFLAAARLAIALALLLLIGSSLPALTDGTPVSGEGQSVSASAEELREVLQSISESLPAEPSAQLTMAWEDLKGDLESVSRDIEQGRGSTDPGGLIKRVKTFRKSYNMPPDQSSEAWDQLIRLLSDLGRRVGT